MYKFDRNDVRRFADFVGIQAKPKGHNLIFKSCPYCRGASKDKDTFAISLDDGRFQCFRASCNAKGNMIRLAKDFGFSLPDMDDYDRHEQYMVWKKFEKPMPTELVYDYLGKRGISSEICDKYHITKHKQYPNVIIFPFYDENDDLQCIKYRDTEYQKGSKGNKEWWKAPDTGKRNKMILFGMDACDINNKTLILTEGQIDSLSVATAGYANAVSVPTGANGFTWVQHCYLWLKNFDRLIVFGDNEKGHITLLDEMLKRFDGRVYRIPDKYYIECKDANEILQKGGKQAIIDAIEHAEQVAIPAIKNLADVKAINIGDMERIQTGLDELDKIIGGYFFGQLILITGLRGDGKSTFASQTITIALKQNISCFAYSGELSDWYFKMWMNRQVAGPSNIQTDSRSNEYYLTDNTIAKVNEFYRIHNMTIFDNAIIGTDEYTNILDVLETAIKQNGSRALFIDNLMTAIDDDVSTDLYRAQSNFVKSIALLAKKYNVLIFLICHPKKTMNAHLDNDDISGSSNISNLADVVLSYSRTKPDAQGYVDDSIRELRVLKNRLTGKLNLQGIKLKYDDASKRICAINKNCNWSMIDDTEPVFEEIDISSEQPF